MKAMYFDAHDSRKTMIIILVVGFGVVVLM